MKIIGEGGGDGYICTVHHTELEKFLNLYYGKMNRLRVGDTVDLGRGYDFASQIADAMRKTKEFVQANQQVVTAIMNGMNYERIQQDASAPTSTGDQPNDR